MTSRQLRTKRVTTVRAARAGRGHLRDVAFLDVTSPTSAELFRAWFEHSPFTQQLGLRIGSLEPDRAEVVMPFDSTRTTYGDIVHGGAIATLADVAATGAAWSAAELSDSPRGATASMSIQYLSAGRGELRARARVLRRGSLCACDVEVVDADERLVAKALVSYKLG